eukprot:GEMP01064201.1.p1 GENE.GEMP01064201.1~~GEMP01064201.1.p1  ORF type:complete len:340 (+),score=61.32 GEMP01064201.1:44-1021(+)
MSLPFRDWTKERDDDYLQCLANLLKDRPDLEARILVAHEDTDLVLDFNTFQLHAHQAVLAEASPTLAQKFKDFQELKVQRLLEKSRRMQGDESPPPTSDGDDEGALTPHKLDSVPYKSESGADAHQDGGDRYVIKVPDWAGEDQQRGWSLALQVLYHPELLTHRDDAHFPNTTGAVFCTLFHALLFLGVESVPVLHQAREFLEARPSVPCLFLSRRYGYCQKGPGHGLLDFEKFILHTLSRFPEAELKRFRGFAELDVETKLEIFELRVYQLEALFKDPKIRHRSHFRDQRVPQIIQKPMPVRHSQSAGYPTSTRHSRLPIDRIR